MRQKNAILERMSVLRNTQVKYSGREGTRTPTPDEELDPKSSASANSATRPAMQKQ